MEYFEIPSWRDYQHYKDRDPPWIKLHFSILSSRMWVSLDDASKALAIACMLIASRNQGKVPNDPEYICRVAYLKKADLNPLIKCGFIVNASICYQEQANDTTEERRGRGETEKNKAADASLASQSKAPDCPYDEIIQIYHQELPSLRQVVVLNDQRRGFIRGRWRDLFADGDFSDKHEGLIVFTKFFRYVAKSPFLMGKTNGDRPFQADLEWLMRPTNFAKVVEGKYHAET